MGKLRESEGKMSSCDLLEVVVSLDPEGRLSTVEIPDGCVLTLDRDNGLGVETECTYGPAVVEVARA